MEGGLVYHLDDREGIMRQRSGDGFVYLVHGKPASDPDLIARIDSLAIPPAWEEVWISPNPRGHIQATGRDARGRKQYIYHAKWNEIRNQTKYDRMLDFGYALSKIRDINRRNLKLKGLPYDKVMATVIGVMDSTHIRIGNDQYARQNGSYGLSTLRKKHVTMRRGHAEFQFRGKSGVYRHVTIEDKELVKVIRDCYDIPGYEIFKYIDETQAVKDVTSEDVNSYLRSIAGEFTSKDFRTWGGTVLALEYLSHTRDDDRKAREKMVPSVVKKVAKDLGNTPPICRSHYIHPKIIESYDRGDLWKFLEKQPRIRNLSRYERAAIGILKR